MQRSVMVLVATAVLALLTSSAMADCGCAAPAAVPVVSTYGASYAPAVSYYTPSVSYYAPATAYYTPVASYYAPATAYYAPVTVYSTPAPYVTSYVPAAAYATYYTPAIQPYVTSYGVYGQSIYGTPTVYVPGQPVRNAVRAVTP